MLTLEKSDFAKNMKNAKTSQKVVFFTKAEILHTKNRDDSLGWVLSVVFAGLHMPSASFLPRGTPTITVLSLHQYSYVAPSNFCTTHFFPCVCAHKTRVHTIFIPRLFLTHGCFPPDRW